MQCNITGYTMKVHCEHKPVPDVQLGLEDKQQNLTAIGAEREDLLTGVFVLFGKSKSQGGGIPAVLAPFVLSRLLDFMTV